MYTKIQFLGYCLYTGPEFAANGSAIYKGPQIEYDDMALRVTWTLKVMEEARKQADSSSDTLKVFMMPEFYFRGPLGAYQMDLVAELIENLQVICSGAEWKDWMFVFGTIIGVSSPTRQFGSVRVALRRALGKEPLPIDEEAVKEAYNICLVQRGGWAVGASKSDLPERRHEAARVIMKEHKSGIDFAEFVDPTSGALRIDRVVHLVPARPAGMGRETQRRHYDGAGIFEMAGVTFGLEICLDHSQARLKSSPQKPGEFLIQVQLVPSCGMGLIADSVVAMKDGWALNVDGYAPPAPRPRRGALVGGYHSQLQQVLSSFTDTRPTARMGPDQAFTTDNLASLPDDEAGFIFAAGKSELHIYSSQPVPPPEKAKG